MVKRIIALTLSLALTLCGCGQAAQSSSQSTETTSQVATLDSSNEASDVADESSSEDIEPYIYEPEFESLDDEELLDYIEDSVYKELVDSLSDEGYYVENVEAIYVSQEYLEETAYNSQSNIFFGYTLEDIHEVYGDKRFVFTTDDEGKTVVTEFENYDDTYDRIIKNVAIGSGVILLCVTVAVVTGGAGAPAVSMIFAMAAKTGTIMALSSAGIGGLAAGVTTQLETGDVNQTLKAVALESSEQFKWGAIIGSLTGGAVGTAKYASAMKALKGVELNLTLQEAAAIQMETGYPAELIAEFHSMEEFEVFKNAGLTANMVNGKLALTRTNIDLNYVSPSGETNLQLMKAGNAPFDPTGARYQLHHIGQEANGTLAILTEEEHKNAALHGFKALSEIDRAAFDSIRSQFWKTMAYLLENGLI